MTKRITRLIKKYGLRFIGYPNGILTYEINEPSDACLPREIRHNVFVVKRKKKCPSTTQ